MDSASGNDITQVEVRFEFTKAEFEAAMRAMLLRLVVNRVVVATGLALVAVGAVFLSMTGDDHAFITPGVFLLAYMGAVVLFVPRWRWRSAKAVHGQQCYSFDEAGMVFGTPVSETRLAWGYFPALVESRQFYFFRSRRRICNPIPKRALSSGDEERFRTFTERHMATKLTSKGTG